MLLLYYSVTKNKKKMIDFLKSIFHKCKMKTIDIPYSNRKGEIWIQECVCGKQQEVMFNHYGDCVSIKSKQRK